MQIIKTTTLQLVMFLSILSLSGNAQSMHDKTCFETFYPEIEKLGEAAKKEFPNDDDWNHRMMYVLENGEKLQEQVTSCCTKICGSEASGCIEECVEGKTNFMSKKK